MGINVYGTGKNAAQFIIYNQEKIDSVITGDNDKKTSFLGYKTV